MIDQLHFGLIGCGRVAPRHAESFAQLAGATLAAVADVRASRADRFAKEYHAEAYTDYRRLLERADIAAVSICTPSGLHAAMAIEAMQAGKHVIVEKPMAMSLADADAMIRASVETGRKLCVVLQNRYNPPMQDFAPGGG